MKDKYIELYKDIPYSNKALDIMIEMQLALQLMYGEKKGTVTPKTEDKSMVT